MLEPNITLQLVSIQTKLKAPKSEYNSFGNYKYRSAEDILEAVKPLASEQECAITLVDELLNIGARYYVKATAYLTNSTGQMAQATAYAREAKNKKGMDEAQVTGSASSYARKYALNGLFAIDDTKDPDTQDNTAQGDVQKPQANVKRPATAPQKKMIFDLLLRLDIPKSDQVEYLNKEFNVGDDLDLATASQIIGALKNELGESDD